METVSNRKAVVKRSTLIAACIFSAVTAVLLMGIVSPAFSADPATTPATIADVQAATATLTARIATDEQTITRMRIADANTRKSLAGVAYMTHQNNGVVVCLAGAVSMERVSIGSAFINAPRGWKNAVYVARVDPSCLAWR